MALFIAPIKYENGRLYLLDQTLLPGQETYQEITTKEDLWDSIYKLKVRGAPAIGVAAAYGMAVCSRAIQANDLGEFAEKFYELKEHIASSRPTAVNLFWALNRMESRLLSLEAQIAGISSWKEQFAFIQLMLLDEAEQIRKEDEEACYAMGEHGLSLLKKGMGILTHCNAGTIATAKYGTCLAPLYLGQERNFDFRVFADETRPLLQGARLTAWELHKAGIDVTLICDNMASIVMKNGWVDAVVVGCDRMAANGDGANKIGTSGLAILAKEYGIPFYMFVPTSTIDLNTSTGKDIHIEERKGEEIYKMWYEKPMAPEGIKTYNPAFDVTDAKYITAVVTEKGVVYPPYDLNLPKLFSHSL
ncbi:S-methyl-5-thioribose-1-phosphate isomerase [Clostridium aminobutyricum]|uniref:Methylthioribose-1-phosphate isomerase n=1 Tax=Clostridium aminobutyricum TaxID=33953 RepID=A0A939D8K4_CLOAM|nr:S-methyl-5-thioribose-1-phosphate isomerase [Clostridium aminobutyricum]MBN7773062.1 S-methyl-5-thioribose-1-phosphate isomerase [Clostridium aminobutyricum]